MNLRRQELTTGDGASVYQAGGNIINNGPSMAEMQDIALSVYRANALELRGIAEDIATARAERITNDYLKRLMDEHPAASANLADPDVQSVMFEVQKSYARSGEEDLATVLVNLLADRTTEVERSLRTLVLNEAIASVPKLTAAQRRAIALVFLMRYTKPQTTELKSFMSGYVVDNLLALGTDYQLSLTDIQHIEYVGAGSPSPGELDFTTALISGAEGHFTNGFPPDTIPDHLRFSSQADEMFVPCSREPANVRVAVLGDDDVPELAKRLGVPEWAADLKTLSATGRMTPQDVLAEAIDFDERVRILSEVWAEQGLSRLTLTSVGLAIGHSYWKQITGASAPLSVWL